MYRRLPPLNALRAFEAAARNKSFTKAATELAVTQGAISRQIHNLEEHLQAPVFIRNNNVVELTELGQSLLPAATLAFDTIDRSFQAARSRQSIIRLQVSPTYAVRWLMPRLETFSALFPTIEVRVSITYNPYDLDLTLFDAGIIHGAGNWPNLSATLLAEEALVPVCSRDLYERVSTPVNEPSLSDMTLLHMTTDRRDWPKWLRNAGISNIDAYAGATFETMDMAIRSAEHGQGVTLGDICFITNALKTRQLIMLEKQAQHTGLGTYFVAPADDNTSESLTILRQWLLETSPLKDREVQSLFRDLQASSSNPEQDNHRSL